ncbi:MAG TPA: FtsX-like permease family protein [Opitutaceae bacterium]|nr:FtsX-like permease family protein [Opitutaceae bacterium]
MSFVLKMAWRDSRAARRRLLLAAFSIVLGIAALVAIGSFTANLRRAVDDQSKQLLGADLAVTSRQPLPADVEQFLRALGGGEAREVSFTSMMVFPASDGQTRLVQVRALEGGFPFYGEFVTEPAGAAGRLRTADNVAILEDTLMAQFGVRPGDAVKLGRSTFIVAGALKKIPGESVANGLFAPRAFVPLAAVPATGLLNAGSIARHRTFVKLPPGRDAEAIAAELREKFSGERLGVETVAGRKRELGRALTNVDAFLSLVGFVALLLGAIGVASAVQVYVRQKLPTVAVLRCLGASARQGFAIYVAQGLALGAIGAVAGAALGVAVQLALPALVRGLLPVQVDFFISWPAVTRGAGAGMAICVLFALLPLLAVRRVPPLAVLRAESADGAARRDPWRATLLAVIALAVTAFSVLQAPRPIVGLGFAATLGASFGVLAGLARLVTWAARRFFPKRAPYEWRQGLANLYRPNNRTVLLLVSLGLGAGLMLTLVLTRATLLGQLHSADEGGRPNLLFFDIQDDQIEPLEKLLAAQGTPPCSSAPIVTMRLTAVKGRPVEELLHDRSAHIPGWTLRREYRSTYRGHLVDTEKLTAGRFIAQAEPGAAVVPVSIEAGLARDLQLKIGDRLDFDVQGVPVKTEVASLREVDWRRLEPNFFFVFPTGVIEAAPKFYLTAVRAASPADSARVQQAVTRAFPNVSAIDLTLVLQTLDGIFSKVEFVVRFMALFTVATGVVVLAGAVLAGRSQRLREAVLLRTLGATRAQLLKIQFMEYALLGTLAAVTGGALAVAAGWLLAHFVFEAPLVVPPLVLAAGVAGVAAVTVATGWLANRGVADHPPLEVLRREG